MKRHFDYDDDELLAIYNAEDDSFAKLIDLECAYAGAPLIPLHPGSEPSRDIVEKDISLYCVGDFCFTTMEEAKTLYEVLITLKLWRSEYAATEYYAKPLVVGDYQYPEIKVEKIYSKELREKVIGEIKTLEDQKKEWRKLKDEYDDATAKRQEIAEEINERVRNHEMKMNRYRCMVNRFNEYMDLADGVKDIALNFLEKANPDYGTEFPEFFVRDEAKE